jgi:FAD linked oxidases, C-terminal domain
MLSPGTSTIQTPLRHFVLLEDIKGGVQRNARRQSLKRGVLSAQLGDRGMELHAGIKATFDPRGLMNPGKKS